MRAVAGGAIALALAWPQAATAGLAGSIRPDAEAPWLWQRARHAGEASALESTMLAAYRCRPNAAALAADLSVAVRQGLLGVAAAEEAPGSTHA